MVDGGEGEWLEFLQPAESGTGGSFWASERREPERVPRFRCVVGTAAVRRGAVVIARGSKVRGGADFRALQLERERGELEAWRSAYLARSWKNAILNRVSGISGGVGARLIRVRARDLGLASYILWKERNGPQSGLGTF